MVTTLGCVNTFSLMQLLLIVICTLRGVSIEKQSVSNTVLHTATFL